MENQTQIRKISVGPDYKDAMHYSVGQEVYGGHTISNIIQSSDKTVTVFIKKLGEQKMWKQFNPSVAISLEFDLEY
jgi:hypothetical protein